MIEYFRCKNQSCQQYGKILEVTADVCAKSDCPHYREPIAWWLAVWERNPKLKLGAGVGGGIFLLFVILMGLGADNCNKQYTQLSNQAVSLEQRLQDLVQLPKPTFINPEQLTTQAQELQNKALALYQQIQQAMKGYDKATALALLNQLQTVLGTINNLAIPAADKVISARSSANQLLYDYQNFEGRLEGFVSQARMSGTNDCSNTGEMLLDQVKIGMRQVGDLGTKFTVPPPPPAISTAQQRISRMFGELQPQVNAMAAVDSQWITQAQDNANNQLVTNQIITQLGGNRIASYYRYKDNPQFTYDAATLGSRDEANLQQVAQVIATKYPQSRVFLFGFTDEVGDAAYNFQLSKARAEYVAGQFRLSEVFRRAQIQTEPFGFGSQLPLDTSGTDAGRARNRRVEIYVVLVTQP